MKAAVVDTLGTPPRYADFDEPHPEGDVVIATVAAASLKNLDRGLVSGNHYGSAALPLPFVAGVDGVARLEDGRQVYTRARFPYGLMSERTVVDPRAVVELPADLDPVLGAAIPNPGLSAWLSLEHAAQLQPGQSVLVLGATGVTGSVAVQLAKAQFGAGRVVAAGRNQQRLEQLSSMGADAVIRIDDDFAKHVAAEHASQPFDAVLDYLWGTPAEQVLAVLGNSGLESAYHATRYVEIGSMAGATLTLDAGILRSSGIELLGLGLGSIPAQAQAAAVGEVLPKLFAMGASGHLNLDVQARPLRDVEQLWATREPSGTRIVLVP